MTGHRPWRELFERTFTPEERARIRADARKMLEEDDRRRDRPAGGTPDDDREEGAGEHHAETGPRVARARPVTDEGC